MVRLEPLLGTWARTARAALGIANMPDSVVDCPLVAGSRWLREAELIRRRSVVRPAVGRMSDHEQTDARLARLEVRFNWLQTNT